MVKRFLKRVPGARRLARFLKLASESNHRAFLLETLPKGSVCAEIGVHEGNFSARILRIVRPTRLHLIDPWKYEESDRYKQAWYGGKARGGQREMDRRYEAVRSRFAPDMRSGCVTIHRGPSNDVLKSFPDEYFDWIYIDGNHLYEFVKQDLELSFKKTRPGGYISGDDYKAGGWWEGGVKKAVDEFLHEQAALHLITKRNRQFVVQKT